MNTTTSRKRSFHLLVGLAAASVATMGCSKDTTPGGEGGAGGAATTTSTSSVAATGTAASAGGATSSSAGTGTTASAGGAGGATSSSTAAASSAASAGVTSSATASSGTTAASTGTTMASTGSTATSGGTTAASTGSGGASGCIEITAKGFIELDNDGNRADYGTPFKLNLGAPETDRLELTFWGSGVDGSLNGEATGTFDLSTGGDADINSCSRCLGAQEDASSPGRYFFQKSGTIAIDATSDQMNGTLKATLTDVTLVEFDLDAGSVVPNGACLHLASATIAAVPLVAPAAWVCDSHFFADNACDCGCGAPDPDCDDTTLASCDWCSDIGSCNFGGCPGAIDPANNATCTP